MAGVFDCKMCGQCCTGSGGIVVSNKDLMRLCEHLALDAEVFRTRYGVIRNGKLNVKVGADGKCVFFTDGAGCSVHAAKPDICRAWPFFKGNIIDPVSLAMAKEYCPGIDKEAAFKEFSEQGRAYLEANRLIRSSTEDGANALLL